MARRTPAVAPAKRYSGAPKGRRRPRGLAGVPAGSGLVPPYPHGNKLLQTGIPAVTGLSPCAPLAVPVWHAVKGFRAARCPILPPLVPAALQRAAGPPLT